MVPMIDDHSLSSGLSLAKSPQSPIMDEVEVLDGIASDVDLVLCDEVL